MAERGVDENGINLGDCEAWTEYEGGRFSEAYQYLRAVTKFAPGRCFVGAWMSLDKDDRGKLKTWGDLADWLGVNRTTCYRWRIENRLDDWAAQLRLMQLQGDKLGEVDRITYKKAASEDSTVEERRLFYQRAGAIGQEVTVKDQTQREVLTQWLSELRDLED
jgi:hypothetical protein